jgi:hypothetical protein
MEVRSPGEKLYLAGLFAGLQLKLAIMDTLLYYFIKLVSPREILLQLGWSLWCSI